MNRQHIRFALISLAIIGLLASVSPARAQVAGGTTVGISVMESTQIAKGWSVKKTLMGKTIYNEAGNKVGEVEDLIISPDKSVSYVIVGAGGFIGIGRHDVAIPVVQIQEKGGRLVIPGVTKDMIKNMPEFTYSDDETSKRDQFVAEADRDIAKGHAKVAELKKQAGAATADTKTKLDRQIKVIQMDIKTAEAKLSEMKKASAVRWNEFEANVNTATARLRKSVDAAAS